MQMGHLVNLAQLIRAQGSAFQKFVDWTRLARVISMKPYFGWGSERNSDWRDITRKEKFGSAT